MTAARSGSAATVSALLADGANVNAAQKSKGQTALMWAVSEGHVDTVSELLDSGADVHAKTLGGFTTILFAARTGNTDVARRLLGRGANVNDADTEGSTPILVATVRGHVDLALFFLEHGADPDGDAETIGYTPLHWASTKSETVITNDYTEAPGEWAALAGIPDRAGKAALIRALVAHGAEINARVTKDLPRYGFGLFKRNHLPGGTPFYLASMVADLEVMRLLLEMGADPSLKGEGDETALMVAAGLTHMDNESRVPEEDRLDAVKLLVELGAELQPVNNNGYNVIHAAAWAGLDSVIEYLSGLGADINLPNEGGQTPLGIAEGNTIGGFFSDRPSTAVLLRRLGAASEGAVTLDRTIEQQNDRRERQGTNSSGALSDEEPQP